VKFSSTSGNQHAVAVEKKAGHVEVPSPLRSLTPGSGDSFTVENGQGHMNIAPRTFGGLASDNDTKRRDDVPKAFLIDKVSTTGQAAPGVAGNLMQLEILGRMIDCERMKFSLQSGMGVVVVAALTAVLCPVANGQDAQSKDAQTREVKGMPPRATPADYQAHDKIGAVTVAAEFAAHGVPTPEATFSTEDYVVVEVGFFGPPEARLKLSTEDFTLRINGKKTPLPAQPYALVFKSLTDPEWVPPAPPEKSKTSIGGGGGQDSTLPPPVHMPFELRRAMEQRVQKATLPEGERVLPAAGLIFFQHRGKINSVELIYTGSAGNSTLTLQP
jgi:hypothetical protein